MPLDKPPVDEEQGKELPIKTNRQQQKMPAVTQDIRAIPVSGNPENTILMGDAMIEIKPTKLLYQRNRTASFYKLLDIYPIADILVMEAGTFGDDRDGDKALYDWLIAVTDNEDFIRAHYDEMDTDLIERILTIFKRVNRIDEKEAHQKKTDGGEGITLDRAVALIAAHLGVVDESQINAMSYVFFEDVLSELGHKLHYDAVVNYAGNSFMEKSWDLIAEHNPMNMKTNRKGGKPGGLAGFLGHANIQIAGG